MDCRYIRLTLPCNPAVRKRVYYCSWFSARGASTSVDWKPCNDIGWRHSSRTNQAAATRSVNTSTQGSKKAEISSSLSCHTHHNSGIFRTTPISFQLYMKRMWTVYVQVLEAATIKLLFDIRTSLQTVMCHHIFCTQCKAWKNFSYLLVDVFTKFTVIVSEVLQQIL